MQSGHDSDRGRRREPRKLHAGKAHDVAELRRWLRSKRIGDRIARPGIDSGHRVGRHRWVVERTFAWLPGCRYLSLRYERNPRDYLAFLTLAAALVSYERLGKLTT